MAARILAFLAAVAMIVGAVVYRSSLESDSSASPDGPVASEVVCAAELGPVCSALPGATVEPAGATADRLIAARSAGEGGVAVWLAPGPWAAMVEAGRGANATRLFRGRSEALAHTPLVAVVRKGRLPSECAGGQASWSCLGDAAQKPAFRMAGDPASHAVGLFVRAAALSGHIGNTDFGSNDIDDTSAAWLSNVGARLTAARGFGATSLQDFLLKTGSADVFLTTGATAASLPPTVDLFTPTPPATIEAVLARTTNDDDGAAGSVSVAEVTSALRAAGWTVGRPTGDDGLPSPGVLQALREVVS